MPAAVGPLCERGSLVDDPESTQRACGHHGQRPGEPASYFRLAFQRRKIEGDE